MILERRKKKKKSQMISNHSFVLENKINKITQTVLSIHAYISSYYHDSHSIFYSANIVIISQLIFYFFYVLFILINGMIILPYSIAALWSSFFITHYLWLYFLNFHFEDFWHEQYLFISLSNNYTRNIFKIKKACMGRRHSTAGRKFPCTGLTGFYL